MEGTRSLFPTALDRPGSLPLTEVGPLADQFSSQGVFARPRLVYWLLCPSVQPERTDGQSSQYGHIAQQEAVHIDDTL